MRTASYFLRSRDSGAAKKDSPSPMPMNNQSRPLFPTSTTQQSASGAGALLPDGRPNKAVTFGAGGRYPSRKNPSETNRKRSAADSGARSGRLKRLRTATAATAKDATLTGYLGMLPTEVRRRCVFADICHVLFCQIYVILYANLNLGVRYVTFGGKSRCLCVTLVRAGKTELSIADRPNSFPGGAAGARESS